MAKGKERPTGSTAGSTSTNKSAAPKSAAGTKPAPERRPEKPAVSTPASRPQGGIAVGGGNAGSSVSRLSPEEIYKLIQESAYFKAKARGFAPGHEVQDWIEAEAEVRRRLDDRAA